MNYRDIPQALLEGDDSGLTAFFGRAKQPFPGGDESIVWLDAGALTPAGTDAFLFKTKLTAKWAAYLADAHDGRPLPNGVVTVFQRLGLVDDRGFLTRPGFYKFVEMLPLERQAASLGIPLVEVETTPDAALSTEQMALRHLTTPATRGFHDEGGTFQRIILLSWMCDVTLLKELLYRIPFMREGRYFMPGSLFIMGYADEVRNNRLCYSDGSRTALLDLVSKVTPARLQKGLVNYQRELAKAGNSTGEPEDITNACALLECLGADAMTHIADALMSGVLNMGGWPDLTIVGPEGVALVEVKRKDRLMFHQARAIDELTHLVTPIFADISICRLCAQR